MSWAKRVEEEGDWGGGEEEDEIEEAEDVGGKWETQELHQQNRLIKYTLLRSASSEGSDRFTTKRMAGTDVDIQRRRCVSRSGRAAMNKPKKGELNLEKEAEK